MNLDHGSYPRVPRMNDAQLDAVLGFWREHDGDSWAVGPMFSASVKMSIFQGDRLIAAAQITADGVVVDHLSEAA